MTLRVYLAGNVAIEHGDVLVPERRLPGRQGRTLLAVLAWERDRAVPNETLAEILWDGDPPSAWKTALRALVSKLRGALATATPDARIEQAFGCYQLRLPADAWLDVEAADAAVHEAETSFRAGERGRAIGAALVANAIARRPFLPGDVGTWVEQRRAHLRQIRVRALTVRGEIALLNDDPEGALTDAELIIGIEPYREAAYRLSMAAHVANGNGAQALAVYEQLRTMLAEDLGAGPSPETEAAFLDLMKSR